TGAADFGKDGEWSTSRMFWTQVQNAQPNNLEQFRDGSAQPIVWPPEAKTGTVIYPYENAAEVRNGWTGVCYWHKADIAKRLSEVRFRRDSGQQMLRAFSAFDP